MIFPHINAPGIALEATHARTGTEVHAELAAQGVQGIDRHDVFASSALWPNRPHQEVAAQFLVRAVEDGGVLGYTSLHELSPHSRYVKCALAVDSEATARTRTAAAALTVNYAFAMWNVRKIYFWTPEPEVPGLAATGAAPEREGTLPEHLLDGGTLRAVHIFALYRRRWQDAGVAFVERIATESRSPAQEGRRG
ncbi:hypothetical protein [Nocardiopsis sp. ATB16-24]|uniref:hypothetical protein n=1 Tax=Nocardiopsis sp. ATB16-24 TaxID=3019555 RepID=UPI002552286E|nr:hypothetical protein [Nocardiopsis sp. ATB16-24]